jgi:hypothetical protein
MRTGLPTLSEKGPALHELGPNLDQLQDAVLLGRRVVAAHHDRTHWQAEVLVT